MNIVYTNTVIFKMSYSEEDSKMAARGRKQKVSLL
jgi:hypothetical protein